MAAPSLHERVPVKNTLWRASDLGILLLLISLLYYRLSTLHHHGLLWLAAFLCESWFTFIWLLNMNAKWNPVKYVTYPERISKRHEDLPAVDMFVTTADPELEPPLMTVNTVLSLLAVEYPAHKLSCYVSDDGCSPITYCALVEAAEFARSWVPFCKKYNVKVRAPFVYFSREPEASPLLSSDFLRDWEVMKNEYEELVRRTEEVARTQAPVQFMKEEFACLSKFERGNHPSVVKVMWENKDREADGIPHLVYVAREKRPKHPHHYKAGAMNVLARVSGVMTNAPFMLNVDCDMFANNSEVILHAMCLLLGFDRDRISGFVQCPQRFYGTLKDDPFGNQLVVLQHFIVMGLQAFQGPYYGGTGCFHRRKAIYGEAPELELEGGIKLRGTKAGKLPPQELQRRLGSSRELQESAVEILSGESKTTLGMEGLTARVEAAKQVASCTYELNTCWGKEVKNERFNDRKFLLAQVGWAYGSATEDVQTGLRIHAMGWRSVRLDPDPPAFLGSAPVGGPASLTQYKRWSTGLLEILVAHDGPLLATLTGKLRFRQCLAYLLINIWALRSGPELCYAMLAPYCAFSNTSFLPKASEPMGAIPAALFISYNIYTAVEYRTCGLSIRTWWNNQRMQRIQWTTASLFGLVGVVTKVLRISEVTFEVTPKEQTTSMASSAAAGEPGRFTFDSSPLFVPDTALVLLNSAALVVISLKMLGFTLGLNYDDGPGIGELVCSGWVVLSLWPFVRGLFGKGSYGVPGPTIAKASFLGSFFLLFCKWTS